MGLKLKLSWYDKKTEMGVGREYSSDFGDDACVLNALGIAVENNINIGGFDVYQGWAEILQEHFKHILDLSKYDYQVSFEYRNVW